MSSFKLKPEEKKQVVHMAVRLSEADETRIRNLAENNKMKVSAVLRQCIEFALQNME